MKSKINIDTMEGGTQVCQTQAGLRTRDRSEVCQITSNNMDVVGSLQSETIKLYINCNTLYIGKTIQLLSLMEK